MNNSRRRAVGSHCDNGVQSVFVLPVGTLPCGAAADCCTLPRFGDGLGDRGAPWVAIENILYAIS
jgi:hypothetical protein